MSKTLEEKTAAAVLQENKTVKVGTRTYTVTPPSVRTIIAVSGEISRLPAFPNVEGANPMMQTLAYAPNSRRIGRIIAMMMLGRRRVPFDFIRALRRRMLAADILDLSTEQVFKLLSELMQGMEVGFFFGIITTLNDINMLREKVTTPTTASGQ